VLPLFLALGVHFTSGEGLVLLLLHFLVLLGFAVLLLLLLVLLGRAALEPGVALHCSSCF
jgi:hypothetical protein